MTVSPGRLPQPTRRDPNPVAIDFDEYHVSELAADTPGSMSPFGPDVEFPLPVERLGYVHPGPDARPHLLDA